MADVTPIRKIGPVLSPVDYDAWWRKGYMPPSEHLLIDQLAYRGAKVVMSQEWPGCSWWFVMNGKRLTGRRLFAIQTAINEAMELMMDEEAAATPATPDEASVEPSPSPHKD